MTQHRHSLFVGVGFSLTYVAAMVAMMIAENSRLKALSHGVLTFGCGPAFVVGAALILIAKILPVVDDYATHVGL